MLEHTTLLLRPPDAQSIQAVVDPSTGAPAGFVRPRPAGFWERWLAGPVLEVREHEDASLLCVVRCGRFLPRRQVSDADGRRVGTVCGRRLGDRRGRVVAVRGPGDVFHDAEGQPLAALRPGKDGLLVAFTQAIAADPFAKMLVLAAAVRG
jgi:hypothetical protein